MAGAEVQQGQGKLGQTKTTPKTDVQDVEKTQKKFMTSTWYNDPEFIKWRWLNPLPNAGNFLRYKGPNPHPSNVGSKMPTHSLWAQNAWILPRALAPVAIQYASMKYLNFYWPLPLAMFVYALSLVLFAVNALVHFNKIGEKHGFLDAGAARDGVPDIRMNWTMVGLLLTVTVRPIMGCFVAYDKYEWPSFTLWTPLKMMAYIITLDFYFYWYHRAMHEVEWLWKYHKTHHMTKHPNAMLSAFGDEEQDLFDILGIPLMTYLTCNIDFHTWWLSTLYILYVEAAGHTGFRVYWSHPLMTPVLRPLDMDLIVEDHDLHHRNGWKNSANYGKQTRIWDKLFGTTRNRLEMIPENVDWGFMGLGDWIPKFTETGT